jgi:hypothetical protein
MKNQYFLDGCSYVDKNLFPCYTNNFHKKTDSHIGIQRYNSNIWYSEIRTANSSKNILSKIILCDDEKYEDQNSNHYNNYQFITDLFDIIIIKQSDFSQLYDDYILRSKSHIVSFDTNNRYTAKFLSNSTKEIVLIKNPASNILSKTNLIKKRQKLNECLYN